MPDPVQRSEAARARAAAGRAQQGLPDAAQAEIGVIGGSGLYEIEGLEDVVEVRPSTPFGPPSDAVVVGRLGETRIAFVPRHGRGHRLTPTEVPNRANLYALKLLGVRRVVAVTACGSMRKKIAPRDLVVPDQLVDRTTQRVTTFFGNGIVAHVGLANPFCSVLSGRLADDAQHVLVPPAQVHTGGAYLTMEGPQFSTRAEAEIHRRWRVSVIGMTGAPEAKLAREAELCYGMLAFATDYDVWYEAADPVTVAQVVENIGANVGAAKSILRALAERPLDDAGTCGCWSALDGAIQTDPHAIDPDRVRELDLLVGGELVATDEGVERRTETGAAT